MAMAFFILIAFVLVLLNAFFVAAEFGMVRLRYTRVAVITEEHPWRGLVLAKIHNNLDEYLSACQLGITLASLGLGWVGEPAFSELLKPLLHHFGSISEPLIELISFFVAFSLLSFLHIVIGELVPKSLAIRQSEAISLWTAIPLYWFYWLMYPPIKTLNFCANFFLRILRLDEIHPGEQFHSNEELKVILRASHLHGELSAQESKILAHTLELSNLRISDVMSSYDDLVYLEKDWDKKKVLSILSHYKYSRYPIYDAKERTFIGLMHVKDLQDFLQKEDSTPLSSVLNEAVRVLPSISLRLPILSLLRKFQGGMPHFALVMARQGKTVGFVTFDNVLHLVFGNIEDEFHRTKEAWIRNNDGSLTVKGDCPLYALERVLNHKISLNEEQEDEVSTIAGLIFYQLGEVPAEGDIINIAGMHITVEKMQGARIFQLRIKKES